jgi:hypothetical protein
MRAGLIGLAMLTTQGCAVTNTETGQVDEAVPVTLAGLPTRVQSYPRIEETLTCIRETGVLRGRTFEVGSFADSTGKINNVAPGSTGNFLPQGGSSSYVTDALAKAGARVVSTYFGPPRQAVHTDYAINGIFNSLDFGKPFAADMRVNGVGPTIGYGWAQLSLSIQLDVADTRLNRQMSMIQRPVRYKQVGFGMGHDYTGTLVTGNVAVQNQERLQLEAINGPIALGVADVVMREFPAAGKRCRGIVADLLDDKVQG